ncbi:NB-ARC domains-containing protein [Artemisia annua]|uniref:NB-ARC domains-containing protein n=1 Tax=Artemisia annua TaxID=35608 RepID=A0A2U1MMA0_ARTAN|nr:NB-ARC domains-containing protein [Artemisia annua]
MRELFATRRSEDPFQKSEISVWNATLDRLKQHDILNIDSEIKNAFISLKLSYDLLSTENAKTCFLLCSLFPKGALISLERLAQYLVALRMFSDTDTIDTIENARNSVRITVDILKSSFLLLNGNDKSTNA